MASGGAAGDDREVTVIPAGTGHRWRLLVALVLAHAWVVVFVGLFWQQWWLVGLLLLLSVSQGVWRRGFYRRVADYALDVRLEVTADRITLMSSGGLGAEITGQAGRRVVYGQNRAHGPHLQPTGPGGPRAPLGVRGFDLDQLRQALQAHGWEWEDDSGRVAVPSIPSPPPTNAGGSQPELSLVVREGADLLSPNSWFARAAFVGPACVTVVVVDVVGPWAWLAFPAMVVSLALVAAARSRLTVIVSADRIAVQHGATSRGIVARSTVASATSGWWGVRFLDEQGRRLIRLPFGPRRSDVLGALKLYGWPTE